MHITRTPTNEAGTMAARRPVASACILVLLGSAAMVLGACSSVNDMLSSDKVDYRAGSTQQASTLEVPPDLTQLSNESHYQSVPATGTVSASTFEANVPAAARPAEATVATDSVGDVKLMRMGTMRWLHTTQSPEVVWPLVRSFWQERGFTLDVEQQQAGVMQTAWLENRAKLPEDIIRRTLGKVFDNLYDTGERDMFRTHIERAEGGGTDIYIAHHGMEEVVDKGREAASTWRLRPSDPLLEAEMLSRLMLQLGASKEAAQEAKAQAAQPVATQPATLRARLLSDAGGTQLQINDALDVAWRRVGLALDRSSFTVEDRDRGQATYFVRYVDPVLAAKSSPGFLSRLFGAKDAAADSLARYRLVLSETSSGTVVKILNNQGESDTSANAKKIAQILLDDLNQ